MSNDLHRFAVIIRAMAEYPDTTGVNATLGMNEEPDEERLAELREGVVEMFRHAFDEEPVRVAVAVLPWTDSDGGEGDES